MSDELDELGDDSQKNDKIVIADPLIMSTVGLVGDITEESANEVVFSLLMLHEKQSTDYLNTVLSMQEEELNNLSEEDLMQLDPPMKCSVYTM